MKPPARLLSTYLKCNMTLANYDPMLGTIYKRSNLDSDSIAMAVVSAAAVSGRQHATPAHWGPRQFDSDQGPVFGPPTCEGRIERSHRALGPMDFPYVPRIFPYNFHDFASVLQQTQL